MKYIISDKIVRYLESQGYSLLKTQEQKGIDLLMLSHKARASLSISVTEEGRIYMFVTFKCGKLVKEGSDLLLVLNAVNRKTLITKWFIDSVDEHYCIVTAQTYLKGFDEEEFGFMERLMDVETESTRSLLAEYFA